MAFKDDINTLAGKLALYKKYIDNEENTKTALILPFIKLLGYDVHNPSVLRCEYPCSYPGYSNARADYAIVDIKGNPFVLVEAKPLDTNLDKCHGQIQSYFYAAHPTFVMLADGNEYRLYSDIDKKGYFDAEPCAKFRLDDGSDPTAFDVILHYGNTAASARKLAAAYKIITVAKPPVSNMQTSTPAQAPMNSVVQTLFDEVKKALTGIANDNNIILRKTKMYYACTPVNKKQSFCRFQFLKSRTDLIFNMYQKNEERYVITTPADIQKYKSKIINYYNLIK